MFGSVLLDVAIGLIFVYLLISLICSAINELIENILKQRAADLFTGISELLGTRQGKDIVTALYKHPLVASLYQGDFDTAKPKTLPSYIPARTFALALMDVVAPPVKGGTVSGTAGTTSEATAAPQVAAATTALRTAVDNIGNSHVRGALLPLIDAAGNDATKALLNIETWYNSGMDRVSGWYKRRAQRMIFLIGLLAAGALNVDTVTIATKLSEDDALRAAVVSAAQDYAKRQDATTGDTTARAKLETTVSDLNLVGLPIGWPTGLPSDGSIRWIIRVCGWIITAAAVSLGAPFWFDLLNKFMVVRSTVKPHEKSPEEGSED